ncbi:hypothetical protein ACIHDR_43045 [Nocardia sp. NPDC052278]|uniref:hypothetical protein n=1 Tax=unclassified Nocardia TaxID=2637762 RepID=UPI0036CFCC89
MVEGVLEPVSVTPVGDEDQQLPGLELDDHWRAHFAGEAAAVAGDGGERFLVGDQFTKPRQLCEIHVIEDVERCTPGKSGVGHLRPLRSGNAP